MQKEETVMEDTRFLVGYLQLDTCEGFKKQPKRHSENLLANEFLLNSKNVESKKKKQSGSQLF